MSSASGQKRYCFIQSSQCCCVSVDQKAEGFPRRILSVVSVESWEWLNLGTLQGYEWHPVRVAKRSRSSQECIHYLGFDFSSLYIHSIFTITQHEFHCVITKRLSCNCTKLLLPQSSLYHFALYVVAPIALTMLSVKLRCRQAIDPSSCTCLR